MTKVFVFLMQRVLLPTVMWSMLNHELNFSDEIINNINS